jgi:small subunit ribosomal protein S16
MVVRLRLARFGKKRHPMYKIFAADARCPRDGRHLEVLGYYDAIPEKDGNKHVGLNIERVKYWLSVGAQPSTTVGRLLSQAGVIPRGIPTPLGWQETKNPDKRLRTSTSTRSSEEADDK